MSVKTVKVTTTSSVHIHDIISDYLREEDWDKIMYLAKLLKEEVDCWDREQIEQIANFFAIK